MAKPAPNLAPRLVNREAAAAYCGVSANTFSAYVEPYLIPVAIGSRRLFDKRAIDKFIDGGLLGVHSAVTDEEWLERG